MTNDAMTNSAVIECDWSNEGLPLDTELSLPFDVRRRRTRSATQRQSATQTAVHQYRAYGNRDPVEKWVMVPMIGSLR